MKASHLRGVIGLPLALCAATGNARAGTLDLGADWAAEYRATLNYGVAMRTGRADDRIVNGPVNASGVPTTINGDDGDRNFDRDSLIYNRATLFGEVGLTHNNYGALFSGSAFYDLAYLGDNDNDSPGTVNKTGPNDEFTRETERYDGRRARLLDAYAYGRWNLPGGMNLDLRAGRQVVSWGQSLFFLGIASAQGPADGTKSNSPGVETKDLLLPSSQVSFQLGMTQQATLRGYYKLEFAETEVTPQGDYFATSDIIGPGARFLYGGRNPLFPLFGRLIPGTPEQLIVTRGPDIKPGSDGQWGLALNYQVTEVTEIGAYYLRYHENIPTVRLNVGALTLVPPVVNPSPQLIAAATPIFAALGIPAAAVPGVLTQGITTATLGRPAPVTYQAEYFDDVGLYGADLSTTIGDVQVSAEYSYRDGASTMVNASVPTFTRADMSQVLVSGLYIINPTAFWDALTLTGEAGYVRVHDVEPVAGSTDLARSREAYGYSTLASADYRDVLPAVDLTLKASFSHMLRGNSPMAGAFGSLTGEHDRRAGLGVTATYLQRYQLGLNYAWFLGTPDPVERPLADRDYVSLAIKLGF
ncbi:DUF1302 family protein [Solimonas sp. K1W22B-7]|uniref:DUF1302 domain-containing protein n=1 Tax=Solimonas sp. K1W22B-7 TaxID=2303331 RepID=UPI000E332D9C|nr:DUF1302 family protein [Solimonas sp. K1W22B-7]AXQ31009.1 DUF1302 family protein [Solimonas sp. K1W22B-7]